MELNRLYRLFFRSVPYWRHRVRAKEELAYLALSVASYLQSKVMDCLFVTILRIVQWLRSLASLVFLDFLRLIIRFVETLADCLTSAPDWISIWPQILRDFNWQEILFMIFVFCFEMPWRFVATLKDCSKSFWDYWEDFRIPWYVCVHFGRPKLTLAYLNSWVCSTAVEWSLIWFESHQFHRRIWCLRGNLEYSMGGGSLRLCNKLF